MSIKLITDCDGIKQDAIKGVFMGKFKPNPIEIILNKESVFKTPMSENDFHLTLQARLNCLTLGSEENYDFCASIQKGYYYKNSLWHFNAIVGIISSEEHLVTAKTSSVPLPRKSSDKKSHDRSLNMTDILSEEFPRWTKGSVFFLLTDGEDEKMWLQQPLRHCLYQLLSQRD